MPSLEEILELLPAYVLGTLDPDEASIVADYLADCHVCQAELQTYQALVADLALAAPDAVPSPELKRRLLAQIEPIPAAPPPEASLGKQIRSWLTGQPLRWAFTLAVVLVVVLAASNVALWQQAKRVERAPLEDALATVEIEATDAAPDAIGLMVISLDGEYGTLVVDALPPLKPEQQYQLWLIRDDQRVSGGVFSVSEEGYGVLAISSPEPLVSYKAFGVSVEPAGGSSSPTGPKVLGGTLPAIEVH